MSEQFEFGFIHFQFKMEIQTQARIQAHCTNLLDFATLSELNFFVMAIDYISVKCMAKETQIHNLITILLLGSRWNSSQLEMTIFVMSLQFSDFLLIFSQH